MSIRRDNSVDGLRDVDIINVQSGDVLSYNEQHKMWVNSGSSDALSLHDLTDVEVSSPVEGDILVYTNGEWTSTANTPVPTDIGYFVDGAIRGASILPNNTLTFGMSAGLFFRYDTKTSYTQTQREGALEFTYITMDGTLYDTTREVVPGMYNPTGSALEPVTNDNSTATIQYLLFDDTVAKFYMVYGQTEYTSTSDASEHMYNDLGTVILPTELDNAYLLYAIVIEEDASHLIYQGDAVIFDLRNSRVEMKQYKAMSVEDVVNEGVAMYKNSKWNSVNLKDEVRRILKVILTEDNT